jgi:hypothetical protein
MAPPVEIRWRSLPDRGIGALDLGQLRQICSGSLQLFLQGDGLVKAVVVGAY